MNPTLKLWSFLLIGFISLARGATSGEELLRNALATEEELRGKTSLFERQPDFSQAIELYSKALAAGDLSSANKVMALLNRAGLYVALGNCQAAVKDLDESLSLEANQIKAYALRGSCRRQGKAYGEALADFNKAVALAPRDAFLLRERAAVHAALSEHDKAVRDYTGSLRILRPTESSDILLERGDVFQAQGKHERAIEDYQRAVQIVKKNAAKLSPGGKASDTSQLRPIYARLAAAYNALAERNK